MRRRLAGRPGAARAVAGAMLGTALAGTLWLGACEDDSYRSIGGEIGILNTRTDALVQISIDRLRGHGRHAIPQIEIALHTASDPGRRNLITALHEIGDAEAIPILRHFAVYDVSPDIRTTCETILASWSGTDTPRAQAAKTALSRIAELRAQGEGPMAARPSAL